VSGEDIEGVSQRSSLHITKNSSVFQLVCYIVHLTDGTGWCESLTDMRVIPCCNGHMVMSHCRRDMFVAHSRNSFVSYGCVIVVGEVY
jgi:hypothetical protein